MLSKHPITPSARRGRAQTHQSQSNGFGTAIILPFLSTVQYPWGIRRYVDERHSQPAAYCHALKAGDTSSVRNPAAKQNQAAPPALRPWPTTACSAEHPEAGSPWLDKFGKLWHHGTGSDRETGSLVKRDGRCRSRGRDSPRSKQPRPMTDSIATLSYHHMGHNPTLRIRKI